jgi:NADH dehydrogenase
LDSGLRKLADALPEQTPDQGVGVLKRKQFWIDIAGSKLVPEELFARFRLRFGQLTPFLNLHAEPGTPAILGKGTTLTMALPGRGNVQVRVEQLMANSATLVTVAGHPLAGAIRFLVEQRGDLVRFEVQIYDRPANLADWVMMRAAGDGLQARTWESLVQAMVEESGGAAVSTIQQDETFLDEKKAERVEEWVKELIIERKRAEYASAKSHSSRKKSRPGDQVDTEATL